MMSMTLGRWVETWLELYVDPSDLADSTKKCYHRAARAVLRSSLSGILLAELSALDVHRWLLSVAKDTPRAAQLDRVMLSRALKIAGKLRLCPSDIIDPDTCPKPVHQAAKAVILNGEQLRAYMRAAAASPAAPVLMLCCCGLRRSEARGLRWEHVDLHAGVIAVAGQRRAQGGELLPLKSSASYRQLELPSSVLDVLRSWPRSLDGWVCGLSEQRIYTEHRRVIRALNLPPCTLHGLRHSFATYAATQGITMKLLQSALGHAHFTLTADLYADHLPSLSRVAGSVY